MGVADAKNFQNYHWLVNRTRWSTIRAGPLLLGMVMEHLTPEGRLVFGLDGTLERRRGRKISANGIYRCPVRSSHGHFVKAGGLRWLSLMYIGALRFSPRRWALPIITMLTPSERYHRENGH